MRHAAPRPILDVHNVKERGATGTVVMRMRSHGSWHARTRACPRHMNDFRRFCGSSCGPSAPPAGSAEGKPCAGYSGFGIEPCPARLIVLEEPGYAMHAPTGCQPFGRSDRPVAALSAVAICDAMRIGFLSQVAETIISGRCV